MEGAFTMAAKVQIVFYSLWGHIWKMAEAVAEGARSAGAEVTITQVAETLPTDVLQKMHAVEAKKAFEHIPQAKVEQLTDADAIIFGVPTRYGSTISQMQAFLDQTGQLWMKGALIGKVGSVFTSTGTQHGGQETTILGFSTFFFHQGMVIVGCPYSCQELMNMNEITGGSPYGAGTLAGPKGDRHPTENELAIARFQGRHVADIAARLKAGAPEKQQR
jgi:NAD(P)H dehydrogenase (quinone)